VRQRAPQQRLYREAVNALRVLLLVSFLGEKPALRNDISDGVGNRFIFLSGTDRLFYVVEQKMPFLQSIGTSELNRPAPILLHQSCRVSPGCHFIDCLNRLSAHRTVLSV